MLKPYPSANFNLDRNRQEYYKWEIYWWATSGKRADGQWHSMGVTDSTRGGAIDYITKGRKANPDWYSNKIIVRFEDVP